MIIKKIVSPLKSSITKTSSPLSHRFRFHLDVINNHIVRGWAYDPSNPKAPVHIAFKEGDRVFCEVIADKARDDLEAAGLPSSSCAFEVAPDLPQKTLAPTLADMYINGIKVNTTPVIFSISLASLIDEIKMELKKNN